MESVLDLVPLHLLRGASLVLGVTGSIAAYKACELVRLLRKAGARVQVVMSDAATQFVAPRTLAALSGEPVFCRAHEAYFAPMHHIEITRAAQLMVVAPATADFLARVAQGRADELLASVALARSVPLAVAPAMNRSMWENPATARNVALLRQDGVMIWGPAAGVQACGEEGPGRMIEPEEIIMRTLAAIAPGWFKGLRVLITAGPTFERFDPVRGITNLSSGRMGFALAAAFAVAGAEVILVAGPTSLPTPWGVARVDVESALEMREVVLEHAGASHFFVAVAAVADYRPERVYAQKWKKGAEPLQLCLQPNPDLLAEVAALAKRPICVGFAAETESLLERAAEKRRRKGVEVIVANLVSDALGRRDTSVVICDDQGLHPVAAPKSEVAWTLVQFLYERFVVKEGSRLHGASY